MSDWLLPYTEMLLILVFLGLSALEGAQFIKAILVWMENRGTDRIKDVAPAMFVAAGLLIWAQGKFTIFNYFTTVSDIPVAMSITTTFLVVTFIAHNAFDLWKMSQGFAQSTMSKFGYKGYEDNY
ncbi:MAG: hypothetical protein WDA59_05125 [Methanofastidiosum sp.]